MLKIVVVADAGEPAGLGHVSRCSAIACALSELGLPVRCHGYGLDEPLERDGVRWSPLRDPCTCPRDGARSVVLVDSYHLEPAALAGEARFAVIHDRGPSPAGAVLVISLAGEWEGAPPSGKTLVGPQYACLRRDFWGTASREPGRGVRRVLVTMGSAAAELGPELACGVRDALPDADVAVLRGPSARANPPEGVRLVTARASLYEDLLDADLVVTAGGQTMLEAAATGTAAVVVVTGANQAAQVRVLAEAGAVLVADAPERAVVARAAARVARDRELRARLVRRAQATIDGHGARRVARELSLLLERAGASR